MILNGREFEEIVGELEIPFTCANLYDYISSYELWEYVRNKVIKIYSQASEKKNKEREGQELEEVFMEINRELNFILFQYELIFVHEDRRKE